MSRAASLTRHNPLHTPLTRRGSSAGPLRAHAFALKADLWARDPAAEVVPEPSRPDVVALGPSRDDLGLIPYSQPRSAPLHWSTWTPNARVDIGAGSTPGREGARRGSIPDRPGSESLRVSRGGEHSGRGLTRRDRSGRRRAQSTSEPWRKRQKGQAPRVQVREISEEYRLPTAFDLGRTKETNPNPKGVDRIVNNKRASAPPPPSAPVARSVFGP